jgi:ammonia channel protein AmtB
MLWIGAVVMVLAAIVTIIALGSGFGKALHPIVKRFPKPAAFLSGAILGVLIGLIPGAMIGYLVGSRIVGAIICFLCTAGCGYAWMKFEMHDPRSETRAR